MNELLAALLMGVFVLQLFFVTFLPLIQFAQIAKSSLTYDQTWRLWAAFFTVLFVFVLGKATLHLLRDTGVNI